jgi:hypothetical protein
MGRFLQLGRDFQCVAMDDRAERACAVAIMRRTPPSANGGFQMLEPAAMWQLPVEDVNPVGAMMSRGTRAGSALPSARRIVSTTVGSMLPEPLSGAPGRALRNVPSGQCTLIGR